MPDWREDVRARVAPLNLDPRREAEIVDEIAADLEDRYQRRLSRGEPPQEARQALLAEVDVDTLTRGLRDLPPLPPPKPALGAGHGSVVADLWHDVRYAVRTMRRTPLIACAALVTLTLGIGASTAMFSVVNAVLLAPLPFPNADRLVSIAGSFPKAGWTRSSLSHANFWDLRDRQRSFSDVGAFTFGSANLTGRDQPERVSVAFVSVGTFRALGVTPVAGRLFVQGEDTPGGSSPVVLLSHRLWTRRFGADPQIVGRRLTLGTEPHVVAGVLPPGTPWLDMADLFVPLVQQPDAQRGSFELGVLGRLKPGVTPEQARADLARVASVLREQHPKVNEGLELVTDPSSDWIAGDTQRRALWVLMGAVGCLLLIASVNLVNLLLAQASGRAREMALRAALGASRLRIIRQLVVESLVLGTVGVGLGLLAAAWTLAILREAETGLPRLAFAEVDPRVLMFTIAVGLVTSVLTGLSAALQTSQGALAPMLREGDRGAGTSPRQRRVRQVLVASEVALSMTLLVGAGLLVRSFDAVMRAERGFQTERRLLIQVSPPGEYGETRTWQLLDDFMTRARQIPGVTAVAAISGRPLTDGSTGLGLSKPGAPDSGRDVPWATWRLVTPEYFRAMGVPLLRGRTFTADDRMKEGQPARVVISKRAADLLYPGEDPVGRQVTLWKGQGDRPGEVVGVVGDMRERDLSDSPTLAVYLPYRGVNWTPVQLVLHASIDPGALVPSLRAALAGLDKDVPISEAQTLDEIVTTSVAARRFTMTLFVAFAALALVLALGGIHGVLAYSVARRTAEIGVRVALGATERSVLGLVVGQGMRPVLAGLAVGLLAAVALSRLLNTLLVGVPPTDPLTYAVVAVVLLAAATLACVIPARKALRVDVTSALRIE